MSLAEASQRPVEHARGSNEKLDTRSKLEAVARAHDYGLLSDDQSP